MTKSRLLRKHGGVAPLTQDFQTIQHICGWKGGDKSKSKAMARGAKKQARHMADETRWQGGSKILLQSTATTQPASDYTRQVSPRDGASFMGQTGKTWLRK